MCHIFSRTKDDMLINLVRNYPIIYDPADDNFRNLILKHRVWESISGELKIPLADVKKRWRHFRDHYLKKQKLREAGQVKGKTWEHMHKLEFLSLPREHRLSAQTDGDNSTPAAYTSEENDNSQQSFDTDDDEFPLGHYADVTVKKRKYSSDSPEVKQEEEAGGARGEARPQAAEAVHKFFESMADIVAQFPAPLAAQTRLRVCQLVTDAELQLHAEPPRW